MDRFCNVVKSCRFIDLGFNRNKYTWFTTKGGGIKVRLDRAQGTQAWINLFPRFTVHHLNKSMFDHLLVLLNWQGVYQFGEESSFIMRNFGTCMMSVL